MALDGIVRMVDAFFRGTTQRKRGRSTSAVGFVSSSSATSYLFIHARGGIKMHPGVKDELACRGFILQDLTSLRSHETIKPNSRPAVCICLVPPDAKTPSGSTEKSWLHFRPPPVDFCSSRLAIGAATERARALAMPAGTRAQALQTRL